MLVLSIALIPLLLAPLVLKLSDSTDAALMVADWTLWAIFALELGVKTYLSDQRSGYLKRHWFDVLIVALPFLRPLRVVRSARALRALRGLRLISLFTRNLHSVHAVFTERGLHYALLIISIVVVVSAGLVAVFEDDGQGTIQGFDDALWWAAATVTTVGYGDKVPDTPAGKGIGVFLMLTGITMFGLITANLAAFLAKPDSPTAEDAALDDIRTALRRLEEKIDQLASDRTAT